VAAWIEPGDLDVDLSDAQPGEVLDAVAHVCAQFLDGGGQRRGKDQAEVEMEDGGLPVELALGIGPGLEVASGADSQDPSGVGADVAGLICGLGGDLGDDPGRNGGAPALRAGVRGGGSHAAHRRGLVPHLFRREQCASHSGHHSNRSNGPASRHGWLRCSQRSSQSREQCILPLDFTPLVFILER